MTQLLLEADKVRTDLLTNGSDAEGTILSLWSLDVNINDQAVGMEFLVEVDIPGRPPFPVEIKGAVSHASLGKYSLGKRVKLRYDPADPTRRVAIVGIVN
jgi:hypothetical protein